MILLDPQNPVFPSYESTDSTGIIAVGGKIDVSTLLLSYRQGIFPWYNDELPLWWNPDPRFVLYPEELKIPKSMRSYFNQGKYSVTFNQNFREVMIRCRDKKRKGQGGTWINDRFIEAYTEIHHMGHALSVEVYDGDHIVGGLYGVLLGKIFYGESMFTDMPNASKYGFISLVRHLRKAGITIIDCQQETPLLGSLGARNIARNKFMEYIVSNRGVENHDTYNYLSSIR